MTELQVQEDVSLRDLTTLKIGGIARYFFSVGNEQELASAFRFAREKALPVVALGGGSNVLVSDGRINAVVVRIAIRGIKWMEGEDILKFRNSDILKSQNLKISKSYHLTIS